MLRIINIGLILSAVIIFAVGILHAAPRADHTRFIQYVACTLPHTPPPEQEPSRAERITRALVKAYPGRVERAEFRGNDWAVLLRGTWFYYAGGRMMPENLLYRAEYYTPIAFYDNYPIEMPEWRAPSDEQAAWLRERTANRATHVRRRAPYFFDTLYQARSREEAHSRTRVIRFLGHRITVHYSIVNELARVEETILAAAITDPQIQAWKNNIRTMYAWNWRNIAGTQTRSFHSYGIAVDILPRVTGGREVFWAWAAARRPEWWNIPYSGRYHPPDAVIRAFELYGFVWGGKWLFFDTMHFEFRPEVMVLRGMELRRP